MHQVYSVMARAGPGEWILDSGASAHMTGVNSLLKDDKEVATTTATLANGDILPEKGVGNIFFKTEHGNLKGSYNTNAEAQVRDLWKTGTRNECKEVWFLLFD